TWSLVCPGGVGRLAAATEPALGWMPSGGWASPPTDPVVSFTAVEEGAGVIPVVLGSPWNVTRQIRPFWSSEIQSDPSGPAATPEGLCAASPGSFFAPAKPSAK